MFQPAPPGSSDWRPPRNATVPLLVDFWRGSWLRAQPGAARPEDEMPPQPYAAPYRHDRDSDGYRQGRNWRLLVASRRHRMLSSRELDCRRRGAPLRQRARPRRAARNRKKSAVSMNAAVSSLRNGEMRARASAMRRCSRSSGSCAPSSRTTTPDVSPVGPNPVRSDQPAPTSAVESDVQSPHVNPANSVPSAADPVMMSCSTGDGDPGHWPLMVDLSRR